MTFAVAVLWKSTVVLIAALVAVRVAHRTRASVRHALLVATFMLLALLPVGTWALPRIAVPILPDGLPPSLIASDRPRSMPTSAGTSPAGSRSTSSASESAARGLANGPQSAGVRGAGSSGTPEGAGGSLDGSGFSAGLLGIPIEDLTTLIATLWAAGAVVVLAGLSVGILRVQRLRRTALPSRDAHALLHAVAPAAVAAAPVDVVVHEDIQSPMTCGVWRMSIVLPRDADAWNHAAITRALVHELEHVARRDWLTQITARAICALYWFHPLAWTAYRQLCLEAEHACDDAVVAKEEGTMYADQLVNLARRMAARPPVAVLGMAQRSDLAARVSAVLDASKARGRAGVLRTGLIATTAAAMLLALAPLQLVAQGPPITDSGSPIDDASSPVEDVRSPIEDADSPTEVATAVPRRGVADQVRNPRFDRVLVEAADEGDIDTVRDLLDNGANVDATVPGDGTPLIVAAREGHIELARLLVDRGADLNLGVPGDGNPLIMAAREGHLAVARLLLDRGANVNEAVSGDGNPLIMAARDGHLDVVQLLLDHGADIEFIVPGDENALICAAGAGRLDVVRHLVDRGANVHAAVEAIQTSWQRGSSLGTTELRTPLGMALRGGHREVAEFLRARGAVR